ncbi:MAG TPA: protein kinase [Vicinamibacterales bacterium]|nr:protein kinase [Vicinamibacterales bacterium]
MPFGAMPLRAGTRVGPYEIVSPIGAGGMGEVYRARDTRLGRDVAVKALPDAAQFDADRIGRFQREAQILAALNHPHIAAIYGLEEAPRTDDQPGPSRFLILELVTGGTLADRLERGALPAREAMTMARQLADALQAAHDKGIIHRDLKPGNVALTPDGQVKVLDFGIAKTIVPSDGDLTATLGATEHGAVMGTAAYMSPEQARGLPLDKRSDIWSFGCLLFESLTGQTPFKAPTVSDMLAGILSREPDFSTLPAGTPARVTWLLRRCLEKDTRRRLHDIADARIELDEALSRPDTQSSPSQKALPAARHIGARERLAWIAAAAGVTTAIIVWSLSRGSTQPPAETGLVVRSSVVFPTDVRLSITEDVSGRFAVSPNGRRLAIVANGGAGEMRLHVRPIDGLVPQALAGTDGASHPFWSPDSRSIAFIARPISEGLVGTQAKLKRIDLESGQVTTLADLAMSATGTWNTDGIILFTPRSASPIHRVSAAGGTSSPVTTLDDVNGDVQHYHPFFLPDGRHFLFSIVGSRAAGATVPRGVFVGSLDGSEPPKLVLKDATTAKYANGRVLFVQAGRLLAQPFDVNRLRTAGDPIQLAEGVQEGGGGGGGTAGAFSVSANGVLAYQAVAPIRMQLAWFDRGGRRLTLLGGEADYGDVTLSRDGSRAAVSVLDASAATRDIWVFNVARGLRERITSDPADDFAPAWSPNGDRLAFSSARQGRVELFTVRTSGGARESLLALPGLDVGKFAATWSPIDDMVVFIAGGRVIARSDLWAVGVTGGRAPFAVVQSPAVETQARFSPDGRWLAYVTSESSRLEVYVQPFPGPGPRQQVSVDGGRYPHWRHDSSEIFFLAPDDRLMSAAIRLTATEAHVGVIRPLFTFQFRRIRLDAYPYDVSPDGRFLVNTLVEETAPAAISLLVNWPAALGR